MKPVSRFFVAFAFAAASALSSVTPPASAQSEKKPTTPTAEQPTEEKPTPYDPQLMRLAEILGSIQYLRSLCGEPAADWRVAMQQLLDAEAANEPQRRERLTAAFNHGYRSFAAVHIACTAAARSAEARYRNEGATLSTEIAARFGN